MNNTSRTKTGADGTAGRGLRAAWSRFWFTAGDPLPAACCRIGVALIFLSLLVVLSPNWHTYYAGDGIQQWQDAELNARRESPQGWSVFLAGEGWIPLDAWWWCAWGVGTALLLGWHTRWASAAGFVLVQSLIHRAPIVVNGEEVILRTLLFYGCFAPWGAALSLDARRLARQGAQTSSQPLWAVRLMQLNMLAVYVISLPYKFVQDDAWLTGDALHWTIASDMWWRRGMFPELTLAAGGLLRKLMTYGTIVVEAAYPLLVWHRRMWLAAVASIVALHVGIAVMIPGVTLFTLSMVAAACLFVPADAWRAGGGWCRRQIAALIAPRQTSRA